MSKQALSRKRRFENSRSLRKRVRSITPGLQVSSLPSVKHWSGRFDSWFAAKNGQISQSGLRRTEFSDSKVVGLDSTE
jgi:hypothetical protein